MERKRKPVTSFGSCKIMPKRLMRMTLSSPLMLEISLRLSVKRLRLRLRVLSKFFSQMARNVSLLELFLVWVDKWCSRYLVSTWSPMWVIQWMRLFLPYANHYTVRHCHFRELCRNGSQHCIVACRIQWCRLFLLFLRAHLGHRSVSGNAYFW